MHSLEITSCSQIYGGNQLTSLVPVTLGALGAFSGYLLTSSLGSLSPAVAISFAAGSLGMTCSIFAPAFGVAVCAAGGAFFAHEFPTALTIMSGTLLGCAAGSTLGFSFITTEAS